MRGDLGCGAAVGVGIAVGVGVGVGVGLAEGDIGEAVGTAGEVASVPLAHPLSRTAQPRITTDMWRADVWVITS